MIKRNKRIITMLSMVAIIFGITINNVKVKATDLKNSKFTVGVNPAKAPSLERNKLDYEGETTVAKVVNARNNIFDKIEEYKKFFKGAQDSRDFNGVSAKLDEFHELITRAMDMGLEFNYINSTIGTYNEMIGEMKKVPKPDKVKSNVKLNVKTKGSAIHELNEGKVTAELLSYKLISAAQNVVDGNTYKLDKNIVKIKEMLNEAMANGEISKRDIKNIENSIKYIENKNIPALKEMIGIKEAKLKPTTKLVEVKTTSNVKSEKDNAKEKKEREARVIEEYYKNDILKQALDAYSAYEGGLSSKMRSHERRIKEALDLEQKVEAAKKSGTVSKEALEFLDEKIKELNPLYTQLVNEGKSKKIEKDNKVVEPKVPVKNEKNDVKTENEKNIELEVKETNDKKSDEEKNKLVEPKVSVENEKNHVKTKNDKNNEIKKHNKLVKTGSNIDTGVLMQLGTALSIVGAFLIRKFKK